MSVDATLSAIDGTLQDWEHGPDAARWQADGDGPDQLADTVPLVSAPVSVSIRIDVAPFLEQMAKVGEALAAFGRPFVLMAHRMEARRGPRQHIRCRTCNPAGNPLPLAVSGADYRRRQRARRRRR